MEVDSQGHIMIRIMWQTIELMATLGVKSWNDGYCIDKYAYLQDLKSL